MGTVAKYYKFEVDATVEWRDDKYDLHLVNDTKHMSIDEFNENYIYWLGNPELFSCQVFLLFDIWKLEQDHLHTEFYDDGLNKEIAYLVMTGIMGGFWVYAVFLWWLCNMSIKLGKKCWTIVVDRSLRMNYYSC